MEEQEEFYIVVQNTCRICLVKESHVKIFDILVNNGVKINIKKVFEKCTGLKVIKDNGFPNSICDDCLFNLIKTNDFILKCEHSDNALRNSFILPDETYIKNSSSIAQNVNIKEEIDTTQALVNTDIDVKEKTDNDIEKNCDVDFQNYRLTEDTVTNKVYTCDICAKSFSRKRYLSGHILGAHHSTKYNCDNDKCTSTFTRKGNLIRHLKRVHKDPCDLCRKDAEIEKQFGTSSYLCSVCGELFSQYLQYNTHMTLHSENGDANNIHEVNRCLVCNLVVFCLKHHMKQHRGGNNYSCLTCGAKFKKIVYLRYHQLIHTGEKSFKCEVCNMSFLRANSLNIHKAKHTGERPYVCEICGSAFRQRPHLKGHLTVHSGLKQYECRYCKKAFASKGNADIHERIHTGYKPHSCSNCNNSFYTTSGLKKHKCKSIWK